MPMPKGTSTPMRATKNPDFPAFFSSRMSVVIPALNMMTMTPISDSELKKSLGCKMPSTPGPNTSPASSAPTTWGSCSRRVMSPKIFVVSKISARSSKNRYDSIHSPSVHFQTNLLYPPPRQIATSPPPFPRSPAKTPFPAPPAR